MKAPTVAAIGLPVTGQGRRQNGRLPPCSHRAAIADPVCIAMRLKSTPPPSDPSAASAPAAEPSVQSVAQRGMLRSEEHTSELQSPCISYAVFCLKKKKESSITR